jgi:hypothetical protein
VLGTADTEEPLKRYEDSGGDGDGEADLGEWEEEGEVVGEDVELIIGGNMRSREDEIGEENTE